MPPDSTIPDFSRALPDRPITVRPPATIGPLSAVGLFTLLIGLLAGALWWLGPDLLRDWRAGFDVVEARGARIETARCRSRLMIVTVCDITIAGPAAGAARQTLWYFFIDSVGREPIVPLQPRSASGPDPDPETVTTNLGLDKFHHRLLALALVVGLLAFCIVLSVQVVLQGLATRQALLRLSGKRLTPVVVALEGSIPIAHKRRRWTYRWEVAGQQERAFIELSSRTEPLFVTLDGKRALALRGPDGGVPLLLDAQLSTLDLTEAEREAFFAACRAALDTGQ
jgi:hypothetical protein